VRRRYHLPHIVRHIAICLGLAASNLVIPLSPCSRLTLNIAKQVTSYVQKDLTP
jgi:hypothetical protein